MVLDELSCSFELIIVVWQQLHTSSSRFNVCCRRGFRYRRRTGASGQKLYELDYADDPVCVVEFTPVSQEICIT